MLVLAKGGRCNDVLLVVRLSTNACDGGRIAGRLTTRLLSHGSLR